MTLDSSQILNDCLASGAEIDASVLKCVTEKLLEQDEADREFSRTIYLIFSAALVFFMQAGFAMLCAGAVRKKK